MPLDFRIPHVADTTSQDPRARPKHSNALEKTIVPVCMYVEETTDHSLDRSRFRLYPLARAFRKGQRKTELIGRGP